MLAFRHELMFLETSAAVIITRPPEIVTCIKFLISGETIFLIFDSHPRPSHPGGAAFILSRSIDATAAHLNTLLAVDSHFLTDSDMQWQAQLLAQYSGHVFIFNASGNHLANADLQSSLATLEMRAEISDLNSRNSGLANENKQLRVEVLAMQAEISNLTHQNTLLATANRMLRVKAAELDELRLRADFVRNSSLPAMANHILGHQEHVADSQHVNPQSGSALTDNHTTSKGKGTFNSHDQDGAAEKQGEFHQIDDGQSVTQPPPTVSQLLLPAAPSPYSISNAVARHSSHSKNDFPRKSLDSLPAAKYRQGYGPPTLDALDPPPYDTKVSSLNETHPIQSHDYRLAAQIQRDFDEEDRRIRAARWRLTEAPRVPQHTTFLGGVWNFITDHRSSSPISSVESEVRDPELQHAARIQREFDEEDRRLWVEQQQLREAQRKPAGVQKHAYDVSLFPDHSKSSAFEQISELDDFERAVQIQLELDEEDRRFREEHWQDTFDCGICLETCPKDDITCLESCTHVFCRNCMRNHIRSKLQEQRFPIFCPTCSTGKSSKEPARKCARMQAWSIASNPIISYFQHSGPASWPNREGIRGLVLTRNGAIFHSAQLSRVSSFPPVLMGGWFHLLQV